MSSDERLHHLDALRSVAMLLGIVLHASLFLLPSNWWPVTDEWAGTIDLRFNPYAYLVDLIHGFRMPIFFLLSGFFSAMLWQRRGVRYFIWHRVKRIGLPLLISAFTLVPIVTWLFAPEEFIPLKHWHKAWFFGFAHLWFLWYLLWMTAVFALLIRIGLRFHTRAWWLLIPTTVVFQLLMQEATTFGADLPAFSVIPTAHLFGYYWIFFLYGVFFYCRKFQVRRRWVFAILPALVLYLSAQYFWALQETPSDTVIVASWIVFAVIQEGYAWLMCFGLMGVFKWLVNQERNWIRYLSDSSYWLYLCHLPLVIVAQMMLATWPISVHFKVAIIFATTSVLLLITYEFGVRYTIIGRVLNGPRYRLKNNAPTLEKD